MSDYPMLISNKLHSFRNFRPAKILYTHKSKVQFYIKKGIQNNHFSYKSCNICEFN